MSAIKGTSLGRNELFGGNGLLPQGVPSRLSFTTPLDFSLQGFRQIFAGFWKNARRCPSRCLSRKKIERKTDHIFEQKTARFRVVVLIAVRESRLLAGKVRRRGKILFVDSCNLCGGLRTKFLRRPLQVKLIVTGSIARNTLPCDVHHRFHGHRNRANVAGV